MAFVPVCLRRFFQAFFLLLVPSLPFFPASFSSPCPRLGTIRPLALSPPLSVIAHMACTEEGVWMVDRETSRLVLYRQESGTLRQVPAKPSEVPLTDPWRVLACQGTVAVVEGENRDRIHLFRACKDAGRVRVPAEWYPVQGFQLTPKRFFFTYCAWLGPGGERDPGGRYATLLSSDWKGKDATLYETVEARTAAEEAAGLWNAYASWAEWKGRGWVLARTLPPRFYLFSEDGKLLERFPEKDAGALPPLPNGDKERTLELLAMDRVIGLVPAGEYLGVVWQRRSSGQNHVEVVWLNSRWEEVGRQQTAFPKALSKWDTLAVGGVEAGRGVLFLVHEGHGFYSYTSSVYEWPFLPAAPEKKEKAGAKAAEAGGAAASVREGKKR